MANTATANKINGKRLSEEEMLKQKYDASFAASAEEDPKKALWDSLSYGYGKKAEDINKNYDAAIAQQGSADLKRGMQRSSAASQVRASMYNNRNKALDDNYSALLADYNNRLTEMKDKELAQSNWERQFEEGQRQFNVSQAENTRQFDVSQAENRRQYDTTLAENKRQYDTTLGENKRQYDETMAYNKGKDAEAVRQWEAEQEESKRQYDTTLAYNKEQAEISAKQTDTQMAYNYVIAMLENGQTPTDELLQRAGLSREDAEKLKTQTSSSSGGSTYNPTNQPTTTTGGLTEEDLAAMAIKNTANASFNTFSNGVLNTAKKLKK